MLTKKKSIKYSLITMFIIIGYISFLQYEIYRHGHMEVKNDADYMIVLGTSVKGSKPSYALQYRIDAAANYLKQNERTIAILSGGQGKKEHISEALAMKRGLMKQGISEERMILEDRSTNTDENITFSKELIPPDRKKGLLVTNDFHMFRAKKIAEKQGLHLEGLSARTPKPIVIKSNIREYFAITKYWMLNRI
ncbi:YdcF family protein [Bacillus cytotoxicus]|uniref:DUF218 domain-containing protein n=1 Tax=Bacillus cytotoxicus (strain DSM 22905 / CIP 110041 / 391-98 / NVH 391-98) TaxID=315749 RepID=A7GNE8_BACCN|nr:MULTISPECIES: YdcF family protein [Bacillus cereus group]ABS21656.1 protein of unknown function DUF218 [Bacillus cytotoxicus NVH 391-98]AWC28275.1 YdcF family protein [Bacillus cytotoxicus]AWC32305.1 YdcF family protein [Bacillus cytotoxicus]AWC36335.1 YdcF family protein [Bacillus cytotoxicus]AWC40340.1 YdcF family protein [Bacillus cytotoxicus]